MGSNLQMPGWICIYTGRAWASQDMGRTWVWPHDGAATQLGELLPSCPQTEGEAVLVERSPRAADPG